jgi:hypothetical protein
MALTRTGPKVDESRRDEGLDKTLADSFPASDPPSTDPDPPRPPERPDEIQPDRSGEPQERHPKAPSGR